MNWLQELETYKEDFIRDLRGLIAIASMLLFSITPQPAPEF